MTANAMPIPIDEPLSHIDIKPTTDKLALILTQISQTVATNGQALEHVVGRLDTLRRALDQQSVKVSKIEEVHKENKHDTRAELTKIHRKVEDVATNCAWKTDVAESQKEMWTKLERASDFIDEMERGSGERVQRFIKSYVDGFLPKWWETIDTKLWSDVDSRLQTVQDDVTSKLEQRCSRSEEMNRAQIISNKNEVLERAMVLTEERRRDLRKFREQTLEQFNKLQEKMKESSLEVARQMDRLDEKSEARTTQVADRATALRQTMCLEEGLCEELMNAAGGIDARCNLSAEEAASDVRVARIQRTPHFLHLRTTMQREINDRMELLKSEVHQDLTVEMFDMQKELKGKVTTQKLPEVLESHKDQGLYNNVRDLLSEAHELKRNKLDSILFVDALKSKADLKTMDQKIDRATLNRTVGAVETRMDSMGDDVATLTQKFKASQKQFEDLQILVLTGKPPDRDFPAISSMLMEGNVKAQVSSILLQHEKDQLPQDVVIDGNYDPRPEVNPGLVPAKPPRGLPRGGSAKNVGSSAGDGAPQGLLKNRCGSAKGGQQVKGLTESVRRASSARNQQPPLVANESASSDVVVGLTASQQAYVRSGLGGNSDEGSAGGSPGKQQWKTHTGRPRTTGTMPNTMASRHGRLGKKGAENEVEIPVEHPKYYTVLSGSYPLPSAEGPLTPLLRDDAPSPPFFPGPPGTAGSQQLPNISSNNNAEAQKQDEVEEGAGLNALIYEGRTQRGEKSKIALEGS